MRIGIDEQGAFGARIGGRHVLRPSLEEPYPGCRRNGLGFRTRAQPQVDATGVGLDGGPGYPEVVRDLRRGHPGRDQSENVPLTLRQGAVPVSIRRVGERVNHPRLRYRASPIEERVPAVGQQIRTTHASYGPLVCTWCAMQRLSQAGSPVSASYYADVAT